MIDLLIVIGIILIALYIYSKFSTDVMGVKVENKLLFREFIDETKKYFNEWYKNR